MDIMTIDDVMSRCTYSIVLQYIVGILGNDKVLIDTRNGYGYKSAVDNKVLVCTSNGQLFHTKPKGRSEGNNRISVETRDGYSHHTKPKHNTLM